MTLSRSTFLCALSLALWLVLLLFGHATATAGAPWPHFRGPAFDGTVDAEWPSDPGLEIAWKRPLGNGYSGIVVAGDRLYTAFAEDGREWLAAFDAASGEELWRLELGDEFPAFGGGHGGPVATPTLGEERLFAIGGHGRLVAVRPADGAEIWRRELADWTSRPDFGFGSSPLVVEDEEHSVLVVQAPGKDGSILYGLDPATGDTSWSFGDDFTGYQSPIVAHLGGRRQMVVGGMAALYGVTARGELLWSHDYPTTPPNPKGRGSDVPLPVGDDRLVVKPGSDRVVGLAVVRDAECAASADGECGFEIEEQWSSRRIARTYTPSVSHRGVVYGYKGTLISALDADDGELLWASRSPGDGFLAAAGDHLVVLTKAGTLHLARAGRDGWEQQAWIKVFDQDAWTEPSVAGDAIFVRSMKELARIGVRRAEAAPAGEAWIDTALPGAALPDTRFGDFVRSLRRSEDRSAAVDEFLAGVESFPVVEGEWAHFLYRGPENNVGLSGDMLGERTELDMIRIPGTDLFYFTSRLPRDAWVSYQLFPGAAVDGRLDPRNPRRTVWPRRGSEFDREPKHASYFTMPDVTPPHYLEGEPAGRGRIETHQIPWADLGVEVRVPPQFTTMVDEPSPQQRIRVYLPVGYDAERSEPYPVVYVFAGDKVLEGLDARHVLDHVLGDELPPAVVVFVDRHYDFLAADSGFSFELHRRTFFERIRPLVEERYRVGDEIHYLSFGYGGPIALRTAQVPASDARRVAVVQPFMLDLTRPPLQSGAAQVVPEERPDLYLETSRIDLRAAHETWDISAEHRKFVDGLRQAGWDVTLVTNSRGFAWAAWKDRLVPSLAFLLTGEPTVPDAPNGKRPGEP